MPTMQNPVYINLASNDTLFRLVYTITDIIFHDIIGHRKGGDM